jgi:hypothetical protein
VYTIQPFERGPSTALSPPSGMLHRVSKYVVAVNVDYCSMISNFMEEGLEKANGKSSGLSCIDVYADL